MKEKELRAHGTCSLCRMKIGECGLPFFYRLTVERFGVNLNAVKRQSGLAMMMGGNALLAQVMGPNEEMTMPLMDPLILVVCERCSMERELPVAALAEQESTVGE